VASARKCIEEYCKSCIYDETQPGSWRQQVEECTIKSCPLWVVRPMTLSTVLEQRKVRISMRKDGAVEGFEDE
jgi:hypothetical protein